MFRIGFLSIIRSLVPYTQQLVYVIQVMLTACRIRMELNSIPLASSQHNLYDIYLLLLYSTRLLMMDRKPARNM